MAATYNGKNLGVQVLRRDLMDLRRSPSPRYAASPMEGNLFEWHFTICGPEDTVYEGGVYHGRILFPPDFPLKPPSIIFLTPSGRFQVGVKICLSISAHHPETWSPAWRVRHIMEALISFLPSPAEGAVGSMEADDETRRRHARDSRTWRCPHCGVAADLLPKLEGEALERAVRAEEQGKESLSSILDGLRFVSEDDVKRGRKGKEEGSGEEGAGVGSEGVVGGKGGGEGGEGAGGGGEEAPKAEPHAPAQPPPPTPAPIPAPIDPPAVVPRRQERNTVVQRDSVDRCLTMTINVLIMALILVLAERVMRGMH